ncbi:hypothetical protein Pan216_38790 [Planctomycetes bacterium Pan216]|uniref:Uncharacterized protein n=1 Tax=Kolteria novifilia TaxID=2527975 RepID=A0A518B7Q9_9BACT|nr:hypothetical protein Pan216_38790 [Planctomycetes bacterium Pan216]
MPEALVPKPPTETVADPEAQVRTRVLDQLGTPRDLHRVDVRRLWDDHYRVNVYRALEAGPLFDKLAITDSFHVVVTGSDIHSEPLIQRRYGN